jgi:hypothetical protein
MARTVSKTESLVGYAIIFLLLIIATGMFIKQSRYNPAIIDFRTLEQKSITASISSLIPPPNPIQYAPEGLTALSPPEFFDPENLSDKIDGKAELYLSAGFVRLVCQRFASEDDTSAWMEAFIYDMGSPRGSYAVYSLQKRFEAREVELGDYGYGTENGLYVVHGPYYLEIVSSVTQKKMAALILAFGKNFIGKTPVESKELNEIALFPEKNLDKESISLIPSDGFGFHQFDSIFTAQYELRNTELTAFLSRRQNQAEAARLVEAYASFLAAVGGTELKSTLSIPGVKLVEIMDTFELFFSRGNVLAGVHGAENRKSAEDLALRLNQSLAEKGQ